MKKILLSAVLAVASCIVFAQDTTNQNHDTTGNSMSNHDTTGNSMSNMNNNNSMNSRNNMDSMNTMNNAATNQQMNSNTSQNTNLNGNNNGYTNSDSARYNNNNTASNQAYNSNSTSNYSAYGIPQNVQMNFRTQYPNVTNLTWDRPTANWYHGYYSDPTTGRYTHVYYSTDPYYSSQYNPERVTGYTVSLPVLQTYVPDQVVSAALNQYKQNLYDITAMKGNNDSNIYEVRVQDNGELKSMWMDSTGNAVTDYYRTEDQTNMNNMNNTGNMNSVNSNDTNAGMDNNSSNSSNSSMNMNNNANTDMNNNTNTKMKTKTESNGREIKTKSKKGQTNKRDTSNTQF